MAQDAAAVHIWTLLYIYLFVYLFFFDINVCAIISLLNGSKQNLAPSCVFYCVEAVCFYCETNIEHISVNDISVSTFRQISFFFQFYKLQKKRRTIMKILQTIQASENEVLSIKCA